jgi:hypothetical protein
VIAVAIASWIYPLFSKMRQIAPRHGTPGPDLLFALIDDQRCPLLDVFLYFGTNNRCHDDRARFP